MEKKKKLQQLFGQKNPKLYLYTQGDMTKMSTVKKTGNGG